MKKICNFNQSFEEGKKEAENYLLQQAGGNRDDFSIDLEERKLQDKPFLCVLKDSNGKLAYVMDIGTGNIQITYLTEEEANPQNLIFPFRGLTDNEPLAVMALLCTLHKPTKELKAEEAVTVEGLLRLSDQFGTVIGIDYFETSTENLEAYKNGEKELFTYFLNEDDTIDTIQLNCKPLPRLLEELTEVKIKNGKDYVKGLIKYFGLSNVGEAEKNRIEANFKFYASSVFLHFLLYEFYRTEDYSLLLENKKKYPIFGLPKEWESDEDCQLIMRNHEENTLKVLTAEEYVLSLYICSKGRKRLQGTPNLRTIADYTGAPYPLLLKLNKQKGTVWT